MGNGSLNNQSNCIRIPERYIADSNSDMVKDIYEDVITHKRYRAFGNYAILSARNVDVDEINQRVINLLDESTERFYTSVDTIDSTDNTEGINEVVTTEYLNILNPTFLPPHELRLR